MVRIDALLSLTLATAAASNVSVPEALTSSWDLLSDGPWGAREGLMVASVGDLLILTGGRGTSGLGFAGGKDIWRSNDGKKWAKAPEAPWGRRSYHVLLGPNEQGCIFLMGGQTFDHFYNDVWKSCDAAESWEQLIKDGEAPWSARAGLAGTMHKGKLYIAGGCYDKVPYDPGFFRSFYGDVWSSVDGTTWEIVAENAGWQARSGPRLLSFNNRLFLVAGEIGFTDDTQLVDVWSSGDDGKTWEIVTSAPAYSPRSGHGVVTYGEYMIMVAGWPQLSDIYYSKDGAEWVLSSGLAWNCDNTDCGRYDFWPVIHNNKLFTLGGSGSSSTFGKLYSETWSLDLPTSPNVTLLI